MVRFCVFFALLATGLVGCSSDDAKSGGDVAADLPVREVALDHDVGAARALAWSVDPIPDAWCWHPSKGQSFFTVAMSDKATIAKHSATPNAAPLFHGIPGFASFGTDVFYVECPTVVDAPAGGAYVAAWLQRRAAGGTAPAGLGLARLGADGTTMWTKLITDGGQDGVPGVTLLSSGKLAVAFKVTPGAGSLDPATSWVVAFFDESGNEYARTKIPDIHLPAYDHPGKGIAPRTPGTAFAKITALTATPDGGVVASGSWDFLRLIECGTAEHPEDPSTVACGDGASNALVAKIDAAGKLLWASRVGSAYDSPPIILRSVAQASDGAVVATGELDVELHPVADGHLMGVAVRFLADGTFAWVNAYPWGHAPGATFSAGGTSIDAVVAHDDGVDAVFHPSSESDCRLVHLDAGGAITRVQELKHPVGGATGYAGPCVARAADGAVTFSILQSFGKIEP